MLLGNKPQLWGRLAASCLCQSDQHSVGCLALAEKIWHIFLGRNLPTQSSAAHSKKCMFLTQVVPFKRGGLRLSNGIKCFAKKHYDKKIYKTQISLLFVPSLESIEERVLKIIRHPHRTKYPTPSGSEGPNRLCEYLNQTAVWFGLVRHLGLFLLFAFP